LGSSFSVKKGQAAIRYSNPLNNVKNVAKYNKIIPIENISGFEIFKKVKISKISCLVFPGVEHNKNNVDNICIVVFIFPKLLTFISFLFPRSAIHSRNADTPSKKKKKKKNLFIVFKKEYMHSI
jgi:hypothetical protein